MNSSHDASKKNPKDHQNTGSPAKSASAKATERAQTGEPLSPTKTGDNRDQRSPKQENL